MVKNKFIKNLYQILSAVACIVTVMIPILIMYFMNLEIKAEYAIRNRIILTLIIFFLTAVSFLIGFYWIFQKVEIDEKGIQVKFFRKVLKSIDWEDINYIFSNSVMRNPVYTIIGENEFKLNLDKRKKIKQAIDFYSKGKMSVNAIQ